MSDRDLGRDGTPTPNEFEPGDEEFEEEPEEGFAGEGEPEEPGEEVRREAGAPSGRRFGFGRGGQGAQEGAFHPTGSVRESHERVHIDDRISAIYVLIVAAAMIGVLAIALAGNYVPTPVAPTLAPLVVPTGQATASPGPSESASIAPSASPTAAPSASPTASPAPSAS
jgi:hypothetical protein